MAPPKNDLPRFIDTAEFSRQSEFVVLADVEDPENEDDLEPWIMDEQSTPRCSPKVFSHRFFLCFV